MLYIRTDANKEIATGHVMRCISIAKSVEKTGVKCVFITADRESEKLITENGFPLLCLNSSWKDMNSELDQLICLIKQKEIKQLLVDSYYVTQEYLNRLVQMTKLIYLDDINRFLYPVDVLINYGIYYEKYEYEKRYLNTGTKLLLGCDYIPLRSEFSDIEFKVRDKIINILITTGGADKENVAGRLLQYIIQTQLFPTFNFHVISGSFNLYLSELRSMEKKYENITVYENVTNMAELMTSCDIAISAGGTTLYELCACGIPSICLAIEDNQLETVKSFQEKDIMYYAGDLRVIKEECFDRICNYIYKYRDDVTFRKIRSRKMQELIDGKGADRIAKFL